MGIFKINKFDYGFLLHLYKLEAEAPMVEHEIHS